MEKREFIVGFGLMLLGVGLGRVAGPLYGWAAIAAGVGFCAYGCRDWILWWKPKSPSCCRPHFLGDQSQASPRTYGEIRDFPVRDALNLKITNESINPSLGGVELTLSRLQRWHPDRREFRTVVAFTPMVLYADEVDLPLNVARMFQLLDNTVSSPEIVGQRNGVRVSFPLDGGGIWLYHLDLGWAGGKYSFTKCIQWDGHSRPEFLSDLPR